MLHQGSEDEYTKDLFRWKGLSADLGIGDNDPPCYLGINPHGLALILLDDGVAQAVGDDVVSEIHERTTLRKRLYHASSAVDR